MSPRQVALNELTIIKVYKSESNYSNDLKEAKNKNLVLHICSSFNIKQRVTDIYISYNCKTFDLKQYILNLKPNDSI